MPRGDGTGPAGAGGRGMGRGRGQGRGRGRGLRRALQVGTGNRMARASGVVASTQERDTTPVAHVEEEACKLCGACQAVCPTEALSLGANAVQVSAEACCGCGACVDACPSDAIKLS